MDCHILNHSTDIGMKSYNPFPIIHRCKYDFKFEESSLKARAMGHMEAAREVLLMNKYKTHEKGGGTTSVVINKRCHLMYGRSLKISMPWFYDRVDRIWDMAFVTYE